MEQENIVNIQPKLETIQWLPIPQEGSWPDEERRNDRYVYCKWNGGAITTEQLCYESYYNDEGQQVFTVHLECNPLKPVYYAELPESSTI